MLYATDIEERLATLESRFEQLVGPLHADHVRLTGGSARPQAQAPRAGEPRSSAHSARQLGLLNGASTSQSARRAAASTSPLPSVVTSRSRTSSDQSLSDLIGGRLLAWLGGVATLIGIVLFLALAISRGWLGEEARVVVAAALSCSLMAAGAWLHSHRGRTEAARAMVGAATAALFVTLMVASLLYDLIPAMAAVGLSLLVGCLATILAIRWAGQAVGALGLVGGLLSPVLAGAPTGGTTIAVLALACACAIAVVIRQRWTWLGLASLLVCAPQWAAWILQGQAAADELAVLVTFAALGLIGALGAQTDAGERQLPRGSAALAALSACLVAVLGHVGLREASGQAAAELWLATLACAHVVVGACRFRRLRIAPPLRQVLIAIGVVLADVAFGLGAPAGMLAIGWAAAAAGFAWLARRTQPQSGEQALVGLGIGAHIAMTLVRALIDAPVSALGSAQSAIPPLLSISALAATCLASARLVGGERGTWRTALNGLGLAAIAYLSATALDGPALVCVWCGEALALSRLAAATKDRAAHYGMFGFLALAVAHTLALEAPPSALVTGVSDVGAASVAVGAIALVAACAARARWGGERVRVGLLGVSAAAFLYLASVAIVTVFQPGAEAGAEMVLDLTVRQQGQVLLSMLWSVVGVTALIFGLRRKQATVRSVALGWLMTAVGKVFLYDLSTLTSIYRVISFLALGLLLLAGAYAYQRLRPPPLPDMRRVHPSQR
jgi:uncharacterized membrane protein